ncbi:MAG: BspA family leucine-rich repeat surface protein [Balneolaceae bacterium]|nr:MAG: BspA family leucine-rich repeat surface protein [Balneolaceae bacterium]
MRLKIPLLIIILLSIVNLMYAQNRYVARGVSDTTDCSSDTDSCGTIFYALGQSVPADLSIFPGGPGDPIDLAGNPRVDGAAIDIGAYEFDGEAAAAFRPFITTWKTDNPGDSENNQITLTLLGDGYDFTVNWGDGNSDDFVINPGNLIPQVITYTYIAPGTYTVEITGDFPRIYFDNGLDTEKILSVEQWGDIEWSTMENAFYGASNLQVNATDAPNLSGLTSLRQMFRNASSLDSDLNHWDVSSVEDMFGMFWDAIAFNQPIGNWNVSLVEDMSRMFEGASAFNQPIGNWNVSSVKNMRFMFHRTDSFNQPIGEWVVSSVEDMTFMFAGAIAFNQPIGDWNVSAVELMGGMFVSASAFDQSIGNWVVSSVTEMDVMLDNSGLSLANYDATLIGWAAQAVQTGITLGAAGLEYCAEAARNTLAGDPNFWTINDAGLSGSCSVFDDQSVLASNRQNYVFTGSDFGLTDPAFSVKIEFLATQGELQLSGAAVAVDDIISVADINAGNLVWVHSFHDMHGFRFSEFAYRVIDGGGGESTTLNEMRIDLAAASVDLAHNGEGWRFMTSSAIGETFASLLGPIYTQGIPGSNNPGAAFPNVYSMDQANYQWEVPGHMDEEIGTGEAFIVYVFSDDDGGGIPDGFPKTLLSGESWMELTDGFEFTGLDYDPDPAGVNPDNFYLIANPHPVTLDFCQMLTFTASKINPAAHFWDPSANGGNGDYVAETCVVAPPIHIAPFQAFWVRTFAANPELSTGFYLETMEDGFFKESSNTSISGITSVNNDQGNSPLIRGDRGVFDVIIASLKVQSADGVFTNQTHLLFSDEGTLGKDRFDVPKLDASWLAQRWISFHTLDESGRTYAYRSLPLDFEDQISLPLHIRTTEQGWFEMVWNLPENQHIIGDFWLRDNHTGSVMELRQGQYYRFEIENEAMKWQEEVVFPLRTATGLINQIANDIEVPRFELLITRGNVDGLTLLGDLPDKVNLAQNYPNPFNPTTIINFELPQQSQVYLEVFDMIGRRVATLIESSTMQAGRHQINFDASGLTSGVYIYRLQAGSTVQSRKLTVIK